MASGDRKVKLTEMHIGRGNPVRYTANFQFIVENKLGVDVVAGGGTIDGSLGTPAAAGAKTLSQIQTEVLAAITTDPRTPANDSVT